MASTSQKMRLQRPSIKDGEAFRNHTRIRGAHYGIVAVACAGIGDSSRSGWTFI